MKKILPLFFSLVLLLLVFPASAHAAEHAATVDWDTTGWRFYAIARDQDNNIVVTGESQQGSFRVAKINANTGAVVWDIALPNNNGVGLGVAIDQEGNPVVTGTFYNYFGRIRAVKLNGENGNIIWDKAYTFGTNEYGSGGFVIFTPNGNLFVLGNYSDQSANQVSLIIQFDSLTGNVITSKSNSDKAYTGMDLNGNPYALSKLANETVISKLDWTSGDTIWEKNIGEIVASPHIVNDQNGDLFLGYSVPPHPNNLYNFASSKLDGDTGDILWHTESEGGNQDEVSDITIDESGNPILTGGSNAYKIPNTTGAKAGARTIKFSGANGAILWNVETTANIGNALYSHGVVSGGDGSTIITASRHVIKFNIDELPAVSVTSPSNIDLGEAFAANGSFIDSDSISWTATVDYGDGTGVQPLSLSGKNFSLNHEYSAIGHYIVTVVVTDNQGISGKKSVNLTVNLDGVSPECVPSGGGLGRIEPNLVGIGYSNICASTYTGNNNPDAYHFAYTTDQGQQQLSEVNYEGQTEYTFYTDNTTGNVLYNIELIYTCSGTPCGTFEFYNNQQGFLIVAPNEAPQISPLADASINVGDAYTEGGSFTDPDSSSWTATVDYGDGTGVEALTLSGNNFSLSHTYTVAGTYTVYVTVKDEHDASDSETASIEVENNDPVTLSPIADSYIKQGGDNQNEGNSTFMRLQSSGHNRGLLKFDESQIEAAVGSSQNYTATLRFTISDNGNNWGNNGRAIAVHRLTKDWVEGNGFIDGNNPADRGTGNGVTWSCATDSNISNQSKNCSGSTEWNMTNSSLWPFASAATATSTITNNQTGVVEFDVTADVQSFLNNSNQNYGWLLKKVDEGQNGRIEFGSKESANSPQLVITLN